MSAPHFSGQTLRDLPDEDRCPVVARCQLADGHVGHCEATSGSPGAPPVGTCRWRVRCALPVHPRTVRHFVTGDDTIDRPWREP